MNDVVTVAIPRELYRRLKVLAAERDLKVYKAAEQAIELGLQEIDRSVKSRFREYVAGRHKTLNSPLATRKVVKK